MAAVRGRPAKVRYPGSNPGGSTLSLHDALPISSGRATKEGFKPIQETAREHVRKILKEHTPEPLDRDVVRAMDAVVNEAAKTLVR